MGDFAVIGLGRFGSSVALTLTNLGHSVLGIDADEGRVSAIMSHVAKAVQADVTDEETLRSLGLKNMDAVVVAIGHDLQASIMVTLLLKEIGVKHVVAKASSDLHGKVLAKIGADRVVFPEREMGARVARNLVSSNILDYIEISPDVSIMEITAGGSLVGKSLRQLDLRNKFGVNVLAIKRDEDINVGLRADEQIRQGDILVVLGSNSSLERVGRLSEG
ncbi:MAG TPA: TrkA family potassium uptake protein [Clostridia bacterium]|nr:TrkA family potassium uptake protein [Clostridia bacterium]